MFKLKIDREPSGLDQAIDAVLKEMDTLGDAASAQYAQMVDQLQKLHSMKTQEGPRRVSPDTWITTGANLLGILLIIGHERVNVITTKALGFVPKFR